MRNGSIRAALVVASAMTLLGASLIHAQRPLPRVGGVAVQPRAPRPVGRAADSPPRQVADPRFPLSATDPRSPLTLNDPRFPRSANDPRFPRSANDPRFNRPTGSGDTRRQRRTPQSGGSTVIIVPVPGDYGYGYGYTQGGYYSRGYGGVYDANGRPLSSSLEPEYMVEAPGIGYTPDLSGSPYRVTNEGMMVVDFANRERRAFPSCAGQTAVRDPDGRPRTIFYQPTDYWMVLRPGQRGRVIGAPPVGANACYAIDSAGNVVLRY